MMDDDKSGLEYKDGGGIMGAGEVNQVGDGIAAKGGSPGKKSGHGAEGRRARRAKHSSPKTKQDSAKYRKMGVPALKAYKIAMGDSIKKGEMPKDQRIKVKKEEYEIEEGTLTPGADLAQRKLNKDENDSKLKVTKKIMEQEQRMAMYSRALGVMGAHYSGRPLVEKESTDERKSAADDSAERDRQERAIVTGKHCHTLFLFHDFLGYLEF